jgi:predicted HTH domain antitoxin
LLLSGILVIYHHNEALANLSKEAGMKQMFNLKEKTFESLIRTKLFKSEEELLKEALDALFYKRPELKREVAMDMYKNKEISLWKAAQMCGVSLEEFKISIQFYISIMHPYST